MEIQRPKSKVYVQTDSTGYIVRIDGGCTVGNIKDPDKWVLIGEGYGDKFNLCQNYYFPKPIYTPGGAYRYKLVDGQPVECTAEEIAAQEEALKPVDEPTQADRIEAQVMYTALMTDTLLDMEV